MSPPERNLLSSKCCEVKLSLECLFAKEKTSSEKAEEETMTCKKIKTTFIRQYRNSYLSYEFTATDNFLAPSLLSIICAEWLSNEAIKSSKLPLMGLSHHRETATGLPLI